MSCRVLLPLMALWATLLLGACSTSQARAAGGTSAPDAPEASAPQAESLDQLLSQDDFDLPRSLLLFSREYAAEFGVEPPESVDAWQERFARYTGELKRDLKRDATRRDGMAKALAYMGLAPNTPITDIRVDKVFIGSCTNSRIEDLRQAAAVARGRRVAGNVKLAMVVPGSGPVKAQAEAEGLDRVFRDAGFEWREPGCSMCLAMNDDRLEPGERCASTSNRNFEGRQGAGGRTHLVSPAMAAAAAIEGRFVDIRLLR